jgi:hypothetical protein
MFQKKFIRYFTVSYTHPLWTSCCSLAKKEQHAEDAPSTEQGIEDTQENEADLVRYVKSVWMVHCVVQVGGTRGVNSWCHFQYRQDCETTGSGHSGC